MMPADIDPSLCAAEPTLETLEDGFSPPVEDAARPAVAEPPLPAEQALGAKSLF
jgi:hypothetical protein